MRQYPIPPKSQRKHEENCKQNTKGNLFHKTFAVQQPTERGTKGNDKNGKT